MNDVTTPAATVIQGPSLTYFCLCTVASRIHVTEMNKGEEKEIEIERDQWNSHANKGSCGFRMGWTGSLNGIQPRWDPSRTASVGCPMFIFVT